MEGRLLDSDRNLPKVEGLLDFSADRYNCSDEARHYWPKGIGFNWVCRVSTPGKHDASAEAME